MNSIRTPTRTLYGFVNWMKGSAEFKSHQNCSETLMDLLARQEVVSLNPTRTAARTLYGSVSQTRCCEFKSNQKCFENSVWTC